MRRRRTGAGSALRAGRLGRGFTLVEVLVALTVMAVLSGLAWRGIDGMLRARDGSLQAVDRTARINTILAQWTQDLAALYDSGVVPPIGFDGRTLLMTRAFEDGVHPVAWSLRGTTWQRWVGPPATQTSALRESFARAQQLLGNEPGQTKLLENVSTWQVYFYRRNSWANSQSDADLVGVAGPSIYAPPPAASAASGAASGAAPAPANAAPRYALPDGVRLVATIGGVTLTRDIALSTGLP
jgi:general secretion pathway protein J